MNKFRVVDAAGRKVHFWHSWTGDLGWTGAHSWQLDNQRLLRQDAKSVADRYKMQYPLTLHMYHRVDMLPGVWRGWAMCIDATGQYHPFDARSAQRIKA